MPAPHSPYITTAIFLSISLSAAIASAQGSPDTGLRTDVVLGSGVPDLAEVGLSLASSDNASYELTTGVRFDPISSGLGLAAKAGGSWALGHPQVRINAALGWIYAGAGACNDSQPRQCPPSTGYLAHLGLGYQFGGDSVKFRLLTFVEATLWDELGPNAVISTIDTPVSATPGLKLQMFL